MKALLMLLLAAWLAMPGCGVHSRAVDSTRVASPDPWPPVPVLALCDPAAETDRFLNGRIDPADGVRRLLRVEADQPPPKPTGLRGAVVAL